LKYSVLLSAAALFAMGSQFGMCQEPPSRTQPESSGFFQIGQMREAIGQGQSGGRIRLGDVADREHFFGVGAVTALGGEVTVEDSQIRVTRVGADGGPEPIPGDPSEIAATFLFGTSVAEWLRFPLDDAVPADDVDAMIGAHVNRAGIDEAEPMVFQVVGTFRDVRVHVISGACPLHARRAGVTLDEWQRPFEGTYESISGTIVGVYAKGKAGVLTHPGTSTHMHLIYVESEAGATVTAHVEQVSFAPGGVLMLAKR
jgi:alpha-acetolactate decarboxylase